MRVGIDARYLTGRSSGIGEYTSHLVRELAVAHPELEMVLVVRSRDASLPVARDRVELIIIDAEPRSLVTLFDLSRRLPSDLDLYHCLFNQFPAGLSCPVVVTVHDTFWLDSPFNVSLDPLTWIGAGTLWRFGLKRAIQRADRLIAITQTTSDCVTRRFGPEPARRTTVIHHGVDPTLAEVPAVGDDELLRQVLEPGRPFILVLGTASRYKNHPRAIRAFRRAFAEYPEVALVLVRRLRRWDPEMALLLADPRLAHHLVLLDEVTEEVKRALYRHALALLFPSLREGFGMPILEAMASGCPVVTSNLGAMAEVAGDAARLATPTSVESIAQALSELYSNPDLRTAIVAQGKRRAATFTWRQCAELTHDVYASLA